MPAPGERGHDIGHRQPGADDQHILIRRHRRQGVLLPWVRDQAGIAGQRPGEGRQAGLRVAGGQDHDGGLDHAAARQVNAVRAGRQFDRVGCVADMGDGHVRALLTAPVDDMFDVPAEYGAARIGGAVGPERLRVGVQPAAAAEPLVEIRRGFRKQGHTAGRHVDAVGQVRRGIGDAAA